MNTDYKILTKLLANRLQKVLQNIINEDQVGYIKKRYIGENIRKIIDIFETTADKINPGIALFLDFEKAFDTVSWKFLMKTIDSFNFGPIFKRWIEILDNKPLCCVSNNGYSSEFFEISRGIRQGCPISALLFILVAEIMSINIRTSEQIKGLNINGCVITITQMADDTTLFLENVISVDNALELLEHFYKCAGLRLNKEKTEAVQLGLINNGNLKGHGIKWVDKNIKTLGVWVGKNTGDLQTTNLDEKVQKIKNLLNMWKSRNLTIKGKVTILNTQAMPLLLYAASVLHIPDNIINDIDKLFFDFIWPNGKHHVKKCVLVQQIEDGGIKMPDIASKIKALKITWVQRLCYSDNQYTNLVKKILNVDNLYMFLKCKYNVSFLKASPFYVQLIDSWYKLYCKEPETVNDIVNETLWLNSYIRVDNKPVFYKEWRQHGIETFMDILDAEGKFLSPQVLEHKFNTTIDIMKFNSLKSAIPKAWKRALQLHEGLIFVKNEQLQVMINQIFKNFKDLRCKDFYNEFISQKYSKPSCENKWQESFPHINIDWKQVYSLPYIVARETFLQSFQYQVINRYLPCNVLLYKWTKVQSDKCSQCNERDTIVHFLYDCTSLFPFWNSFDIWWHNVYKFHIQLTNSDIIFGLPNENKDVVIDVLNYCILFAKHFIYTRKVHDSDISFALFHKQLKHRIEIERYIIVSQKNINVFNEKWNRLLTSLSVKNM